MEVSTRLDTPGALPAGKEILLHINRRQVNPGNCLHAVEKRKVSDFTIVQPLVWSKNKVVQI